MAKFSELEECANCPMVKDCEEFQEKIRAAKNEMERLEHIHNGAEFTLRYRRHQTLN